jgi:hypothetical protein
MSYVRAGILKSLLILSLTSPLIAAECRDYTKEQLSLLNLSRDFGAPYHYELTLPAIVQQESFLGSYVLRENLKDGKYGSFGITHILFETAMHLKKETSKLRARQDILPKLISDDLYALELAVLKLNTYNGTTWKGRWAHYNGSGPRARAYADKIQQNIKEFKRCGVF